MYIMKRIMGDIPPLSVQHPLYFTMLEWSSDLRTSISFFQLATFPFPCFRAFTATTSPVPSLAGSYLQRVTSPKLPWREKGKGDHSTLVLRHHHIPRLICGCSCYFTQMSPRNYLTELTFPKTSISFRKRLLNISWLVSGRVSLGDMSRSATQKKSLWRWYKNTNTKGSKNIYFCSWTLRVLWAQCKKKACPWGRKPSTCWWSWTPPGRRGQAGDLFAGKSALSIQEL